MAQTKYVTAIFKGAIPVLALPFLLNGAINFVPVAQAQDVVAVEATSHPDLQIIKSENVIVQNPIRGTGTIFAHKTSKIGPLVEGQIVRVHVKVGDRVEKGAPLFVINQVNHRFLYEEAQTRLTKAEARLKNAKPIFERAKELYQKGNTTLATMDKVTSAFAVARAEVVAAKIAVSRSKKNLDDTTAYAPFKSVVTSRYMDEGVYVSNRVPGSNNAIIELQKIDIVIAIIQVPVRDIEKISVGAPVKLKLDGISKPIEGKVTVINDKVDIATRTLEIRVSIDNDNYDIKPGLFVLAEILPKSREALVIPRHVVQGPPGSRYVYILEGGKAVRKSVTVNDYDAMLVEVTSGLKGNVPVLSGTGLLNLTDGMELGEITDVAG